VIYGNYLRAISGLWKREASPFSQLGGRGGGGAESPAGVGAWIIAYKAYGLVLSYYFYYPEPFLVLPFSPRRILHARLRPPLASLFPSLARFLSRAEERHASR